MEIIIKNVSKEFEGNKVLDDISLELKQGKIYGFVGRNGSGKSVLLKCICGFIKPTSGVITIDNEDIFDKNIFIDDIRALIEKPKFITNMSGYDNLKFLADIQKKIGKKEIENSLKEVNLYDDRNKTFSKYSLGMKQKLGIAQVIMEDPAIMIFDEPFNGVEDESVEKIRKLLLKYKKQGKIILIATHIKQDIEELCDVVYKMDNGKIIK